MGDFGLPFLYCLLKALNGGAGGAPPRRLGFPRRRSWREEFHCPEFCTSVLKLRLFAIQISMLGGAVWRQGIKKGPRGTFPFSGGRGGGDLLSRFRSTIGAAGFNFSVRDGKRWGPGAVAAFVCVFAVDPASASGGGRTVWGGRGLPGSSRLDKRAGQIAGLRCFLLRKGFGRLVPLGCARRRACTCGLSTSSSATALCGDLILGGASCLDAFSTYPGQTRIPGGAPGGTTGKPEVCPSRSSRTSDGAPQISCAHNR